MIDVCKGLQTKEKIQIKQWFVTITFFAVWPPPPGLGIYMHTWIDYLMQCSPQPKLKTRIRKVQINVNNSKYRVYNTIETGEYPTPSTICKRTADNSH